MTPEVSSRENSNLKEENSCIFCKIIKGEINSNKVYEDDICTAILAREPTNPGHVILMPNKHNTFIFEASQDTIAHLGKITKKISKAQIKALKSEGTNILISTGPSAGQKAPHLMVHIIPRKENDKVVGLNLPKNRMEEKDRQAVRAALISTIVEKQDQHHSVEYNSDNSTGYTESPDNMPVYSKEVPTTQTNTTDFKPPASTNINNTPETRTISTNPDTLSNTKTTTDCYTQENPEFKQLEEEAELMEQEVFQDSTTDPEKNTIQDTNNTPDNVFEIPPPESFAQPEQDSTISETRGDMIKKLFNQY